MATAKELEQKRQQLKVLLSSLCTAYNALTVDYVKALVAECQPIPQECYHMVEVR